MDHRYGKVKWGPLGTRQRTSASNWKLPYKWDREASREGVQKRVFCASLADVFEDRSEVEEWRIQLFHMMEDTPNLIWLVLIKRIENVARMVPPGWMYEERPPESWRSDPKKRWRYKGAGRWAGWPSNVQIGTSVENQKYADERIPLLLQLPAPVRFLSCEPLLGPLDLWQYAVPKFAADDDRHYPWRDGVEWIIVGGESGNGAREMKTEWVSKILDDCSGTGTALFVKQLGSVAAKEMGVTDKKGDDMSEWPSWMQWQEFPESPAVEVGLRG
jgi:protein gp37